jgi:hypothetical protein
MLKLNARGDWGALCDTQQDSYSKATSLILQITLQSLCISVLNMYPPCR